MLKSTRNAFALELLENLTYSIITASNSLRFFLFKFTCWKNWNGRFKASLLLKIYFRSQKPDHNNSPIITRHFQILIWTVEIMTKLISFYLFSGFFSCRFIVYTSYSELQNIELVRLNGLNALLKWITLTLNSSEQREWKMQKTELCSRKKETKRKQAQK